MSENRDLIVPAQPDNVADLLAHRKSNAQKSLHDEVDDIYVRLWEDANFRKLLAAVHPSQCVEGSYDSDDDVAAMMIRDYAKEHHFPEAAGAKLAAIVFSLKVVSRRYEQGRNQRRTMVKGQRVNMSDAAE